MNERVINDRIKEMLGQLPEGTPIQKEVKFDCLYALSLSIPHLEQLFDTYLWRHEGEPEWEGDWLEYAVAMGNVEEMLANQELIYLDRRLSED